MTDYIWYHNLPINIKYNVYFLRKELHKYPTCEFRKEWINNTYNDFKNKLVTPDTCIYILEFDLVHSLMMLIKQLVNEITPLKTIKKKVLEQSELQSVLVNLIINNIYLLDENDKYVLQKLLNVYHYYIYNNKHNNDIYNYTKNILDNINLEPFINILKETFNHLNLRLDSFCN